MDARALREFLNDVKQHGHVQGHFLGLLHLLIGRRLARKDGTEIAAGLAWRDLAAVLKKVRWDKDTVRELGLDPEALPPRDRERYWYGAISRANVDTAEAKAAGEALAVKLREAGYVIGPAPGTK